MLSSNELDQFRRQLHIATAETNQGRPDAALESLRPWRQAIEDREGTVEWAELPWVTGQALTAQNQLEALTYLNEAFRRIEQLHDPPVELKVRVFEHLGTFYRSCERRRATAREFYMKAKELADEAGFVEDSDKCELRVRGIDLENDVDPLFDDYQTLVKVGRQHGFTHTEVLSVWTSYYAEMGLLTKSKTLKGARKFGAASETYFLNRLNAKRNANATK